MSLNDAAMEHADLAFQSSERSIRREMVRAVAAIDSDHYNRGLFNSSARINAHRQAMLSSMRQVLEARLTALLDASGKQGLRLDRLTVAVIGQDVYAHFVNWQQEILADLREQSIKSRIASEEILSQLVVAVRANTVEIVEDVLGQLRQKQLAEELQKKNQSEARSGSVVDEVRTYDVAISYAGEDRAWAEELAALLQSHGVNVFYDRDKQAELLGAHLAEELYDIFCNRSRFAVIVISSHYLDKKWTIHERRAALDRLVQERGNEYIIPIRIDDTVLPGFPTGLGYVRIEEGISHIADLIIERLGRQ